MQEQNRTTLSCIAVMRSGHVSRKKQLLCVSNCRFQAYRWLKTPAMVF